MVFNPMGGDADVACRTLRGTAAPLRIASGSSFETRRLGRFGLSGYWRFGMGAARSAKIGPDWSE
jgi:hypothetical protein